MEGQFLGYFADYPSLSARDLISLYESTRSVSNVTVIISVRIVW